jgi:hypothetical protein
MNSLFGSDSFLVFLEDNKFVTGIQEATKVSLGVGGRLPHIMHGQARIQCV